LGGEGKKYLDEEAAKKYKGNSLKGNLKESSFVFVFEYGALNEGYWCYKQMILQLEDCLDVLKTLHPQYGFLFLFDSVGATQHFVFQNDDNGPFWMSEQERAAKKEDRVLEGQTKKETSQKWSSSKSYRNGISSSPELTRKLKNAVMKIRTDI